MTIAVANTTLANTFSHWMTRTNEIATALSTKVVSVNGGTPTGNASIIGTMTANTFRGDALTSTTGAINVISANLVIQASAAFVTLGAVNIKDELVIDAVSKVNIPGSNATHQILAADPVTGDLLFKQLLLPIDDLTDVDTTNVAKTGTSILMWNTATGKWQTNTITLIASTRINTLNVGSVSSTLTVVGNTVLANSTLHVNGNTNRVGINIPNPTSALHVDGAIQATGDIAGFQTSDRYFKKNIKEYLDQDSLDVILQLIVKEFDWDDKKVKKSKLVSPTNIGHDVGLIAQEVKEIRPDWVLTRSDDTLAVNYEKAIPYLIGAIKHLTQRVKELEANVK